MTACEQCWADASRDAQLLGGSVVDHYHRRIEEAGAVPDHALPTQREIHWQQRVDEIANAAAQLRANAARANLTLQAVIDHHEGHIGTHYEDCWKNHAGCLAVLIKGELNEPRHADMEGDNSETKEEK